MKEYTYFALGTILGIGISLYIAIKREEKIEKQIKQDQYIYSTPKLDKTMEDVVLKINKEKQRFNRELNDQEKDSIIIECYKNNYEIQ